MYLLFCDRDIYDKMIEKIRGFEMKQYYDEELRKKCEFFSYGHAIEILNESFPDKWQDIKDCLHALTITTEELQTAGGNESPIPKKFDDILYPRGWREIRITGDLLVKMFPRSQTRGRGRFSDQPFDEN